MILNREMLIYKVALPKGSHHSGGEVTNATIVVGEDFCQAKVRNLNKQKLIIKIFPKYVRNMRLTPSVINTGTLHVLYDAGFYFIVLKKANIEDKT